MKIILRWMVAAIALVAAGPLSASAETQQVRIVRQFGLGYLQLYITEDRHLIEKHAKALGLGDVSVTYTPLGSPAAMSDALLSGSADLAGSGVPPFILLWDKTRGNLKIKALAALNSQPAFLNTTNPKILSLKDFSEGDKIAVPSIKSAFQAILLEMAAEKAFGEAQRNKLDDLTVSMSHPDAVAALTSGGKDIDAHFTSPPYQYQELQDPRVHRVLSSYEITDGPASFSAFYGTTAFHDANPRLVTAILAALDEATAFIKTNPDEAAAIFLKMENSRMPVGTIAAMLKDPDIRYSISPEHITKFSDFMARAGLISKRADTWQDLFFGDIHERAGS